MTWILDRLGGTATVSLGGVLLGLMFGAAAQQSRFCLRSAVVQFTRGIMGVKLSVWLLAFSGAAFATQLLLQSGVLDVADAKQLSLHTSLSGAAIGGAMFGCGMILSRGCASRLLVLSATGNLRALLSGLVFAVTAQASLHGILAPIRDKLAGLWVVDGSALLTALPSLGGGVRTSFVLGSVFLAVAIGFAVHNRIATRIWVAALAAGVAVALGWLFTYSLSYQSFDRVPVTSMTFTGPSANTLMLFLSPLVDLNFDVGLVPGVFLGSFLAALLTGELELQGFQGGPSMRRYLVGAVLMGFGGMLAGGCAVGNGMTGTSIFSFPAWVALTGMWAGGGVTDFLIDRHETIPGGFAQPAA